MALASDADVMLARTGWLNTMKGRWCNSGPRNCTAVHDETGMINTHVRHEQSAKAMGQEGMREHLLIGPTYDVYEFGVYTGGGLRAWVRELHQNSLSFGHLWGFDSFQGLPESDLATNSPSRRHDEAWQKGGLNAAEQLSGLLGTDAFNFTVLSEYIVRSIGYRHTTLIPGFFNESLPSLPPPQLRRMQPAMLVDIDCDIYEGAIEALRFLIVHRLVVPGTVVYYDDWQAEGQGERKAHDELTREYRITWRAVGNPRLPYLKQVVSLDLDAGARGRLRH